MDIRPVKLNLGCGNDYKEGFVNVDILDSVKLDKKWNLEKLPLPFEESTVDYVYARHLLIYIRELYPWLRDIHRICKDGAVVRFVELHFSCASMHTDLQRIRGFTTDSFDNDMYYANMGGKFKVISRRIKFPKRRFFLEWIANRFPGLYEHNFAYILPADTIEFVLRVKK